MIVKVARNGRSVSMPDGDGDFVDRWWNVVGPALRRRLFRETAAGLEQASVWLNEDGLPRDPPIRKRILTAPDRLLAGTPLRSTGRLSVSQLALHAGISPIST